MKISIITVCYNEEKSISKTIESVLNQTSTDIEYIICDGKSEDNTINIAKSYKDSFLKKGVKYIIHSEKDGGIYFGMNSGIDLATGDYIIFINAGDKLYNDNIIEKSIEEISKLQQSCDIVYGDVICVERGYATLFVGDDTKLSEGMSICHQAIFVKTPLAKENKFNTKYRIIADYDMMLKFKLQNYSFHHIDIVISRFQQGGVSTTNAKQYIREYFDVWDKNGIKNNRKKFKRDCFKDRIAYSIKMKMPKKLWHWWSLKIKKKTLFEDEM